MANGMNWASNSNNFVDIAEIVHWLKSTGGHPQMEFDDILLALVKRCNLLATKEFKLA